MIENSLQVADGLNLGTITVDPRTNAVFIHYSVHYHRYEGDTPTVMMIWSWDDGANWHGAKNLSISIGKSKYFGSYRWIQGQIVHC